MTEFLEQPAGSRSTKHSVQHSEESSDSLNSNEEEDFGEEATSNTSTSGSWSIDADIEFDRSDTEFKPPPFDELPTFSIRSASPGARSMSPFEPVSLFNLSISPISSLTDLTKDEDTLFGVSSLDGTKNDSRIFTKDSMGETDDDDDERISLDTITAQIGTPASHCSGKRLNLETIFEGVFLETPPKKRKFDSWRIRDLMFTNERISSYVREQQTTDAHQLQPPTSGHDTATHMLCDIFEHKIDLSE